MQWVGKFLMESSMSLSRNQLSQCLYFLFQKSTLPVYGCTGAGTGCAGCGWGDGCGTGAGGWSGACSPDLVVSGCLCTWPRYFRLLLHTQATTMQHMQQVAIVNIIPTTAPSPSLKILWMSPFVNATIIPPGKVIIFTSACGCDDHFLLVFYTSYLTGGSLGIKQFIWRFSRSRYYNTGNSCCSILTPTQPNISGS